MTLKNQDDRGEVADALSPGANAKLRRRNTNLKSILAILFKKASTHGCVAFLSVALPGR